MRAAEHLAGGTWLVGFFGEQPGSIPSVHPCATHLHAGRIGGVLVVHAAGVEARVVDGALVGDARCRVVAGVLEIDALRHVGGTERVLIRERVAQERRCEWQWAHLRAAGADVHCTLGSSQQWVRSPQR